MSKDKVQKSFHACRPEMCSAIRAFRPAAPGTEGFQVTLLRYAR
jgi:hypothetical protein